MNTSNTSNSSNLANLANPLDRSVLQRSSTLLVMAVVVVTLMAWSTGTAHAITPTGDRAGPASRNAKPMGVAPTLPNAVPLELIAGTITAIDRAKKTMTVAGATLTWHNSKLRVFGGNGVAMTERELSPGMRVRFAREPGTRDDRPVVLVYIDAQP